ncbi:MAG: alpha/beta fold hydrolase [Hyphomonadaceae bacterium]
MIDETEFGAHFDRLMEKRGADVRFDRFTSDTIMHDGNRLQLDIIEVDKSAPTVVFVPGTAAYGLVYGNYLGALADSGINVVSFDPRGHGRSGGLPGSYTIGEIISDARAVAAYARDRFDGAVFMSGSSQGGIVAFYAAATEEPLAGVICHNAADLMDPINLENMDNPKAARRATGVVKILAKLFPKMPIKMERYLNLLSKDDSPAKRRMLADPYMSKVIRLRALASLSTTKMARPVEEIKTPVLLLHAGEDEVFPQSLAEGLHARMTCEKELVIYPGLGHFLFSEHISAVMPDIKRWVFERAG